MQAFVADTDLSRWQAAKELPAEPGNRYASPTSKWNGASAVAAQIGSRTAIRNEAEVTCLSTEAQKWMFPGAAWGLQSRCCLVNGNFVWVCALFLQNCKMNDLSDPQQHAFDMPVIDLRMPAKGPVVIGHWFIALNVLNSGSAAKHKHHVCR